MNLSRYYVNRFDSVGECRGSKGFNSEKDALEFMFIQKENMISGEFARLFDTVEKKTLHEVKK